MKKLLFVFLLCPLFVTGCHAEGLYAQAGDLSQAARVESALPGPGRAISGELKLDGSYDTQGALERLWQYVIAQGREQLMSEVNNTACLVVIALLTAILLPFCGNKQIEGIVERAGCCAAALLLTGRFGSLLDEAGETLASLADYSHVILPVLFTTAAAGGAVVSASVRYASACLAMDVMISVSQRFLMPLVYMFLALSICQSLYENSVLQAVLNVAKWGVTTGLTVLTLAFGAYLSLTGLIAGSTDALAVKTARTVLSRSLPVVGGLLSDSAAVLLAAAGIVKNSVGVFTLIAVCGLCAGPLVAYSVKLLVYRAAAAAVDVLPQTRLSKLLNSCATAFGMLTGLIGCNAIMLFLAIVSGIKVVAPT